MFFRGDFSKDAGLHAIQSKCVSMHSIVHPSLSALNDGQR